MRAQRAEDLLFRGKEQILRFAQDDNLIFVILMRAQRAEDLLFAPRRDNSVR